MRSRRGVTFIELLTAIVFLGVLLAVSEPLFHSLLRQTMSGGREVQTDRTLDHMLARLRSDVEAARGVTTGTQDGVRVLGITGRDGPIRYLGLDGRVMRSLGDGNGAGEWTVPNAVIEWHGWPDANVPRALEVRTSVWTGEGRARRAALARTHLFFLRPASAEERP